MQEDFKKLWTALITTDKPTQVDEPIDFGFYDVEAIKELGVEYFLSGRNPGHFPRLGGILNQTAALRHDLHLFLHGIAWKRYEKWVEDHPNDE